MSPRRRVPWGRRERSRQAFTLIELLVVMAVIGILTALVLPAFTAIKGSGDVTRSAYDVSGVLEGARSYAMANNTYVYVGFYEEPAGSLVATNTPPPYGKGRLLMAVVASKDGTTSCEDGNSSPTTLSATMIYQIGKLVKMENIHMTDVGPPSGGNDQTLDGRPALPYTFGSPFDYLNRINSDDTHTTTNKTKYPFVAQGYTFWKTIRFNSRGEAIINATYTIKRIAEIGLQPTHGTVPDTNSRNSVAIQFTGVGGNVKIYRQ